jgi:hypothetical protein
MSSSHGHKESGVGFKPVDALRDAAEGVVPDIMGMLFLVWLGSPVPYSQSSGGHH